MSNAVAEFTHIRKVYRDPWTRQEIHAVEGVSLQLRPAEVFGLVGPNRAGKTTLIKILLTLTHPTGGSALRFGKPLDDRETLSRVGYMHENQAFPRYWHATGLLHYYGALTYLPEPIVVERVPKLLAKVGLADRAKEPISHFSKGMVQRLALAQALLNEPDLLVLDEPTEGLDLEGRQLVHQIVREQRERGKTVLLVSHLAGDVEKLCDRLAVIVGGHVKHYDTVTSLTRPKNGPTRSLEEALQTFYPKTIA